MKVGKGRVLRFRRAEGEKTVLEKTMKRRKMRRSKEEKMVNLVLCLLMALLLDEESIAIGAWFCYCGLWRRV